MKRLILWSLMSLLCLTLLMACGKKNEPQKPSQQTEHAQLQSLNKTLHFTGTIQPLQESSLISPLEAVIEEMPAHYGEALEKNTIAFTLTSSELQKQYNDTLTEYLKAKDSFHMSQSKFQGAEELWQAGLLSKNTYVSEKSNLDNARIAMLQSQRKFSELLEKMGHNPDDWNHLTLAEFDKVRQALSGKHQQIKVYTPRAGILLYPPKSGDDKSQRLSVGASVKAGQVLGLIGDLSGVRVEIDVPEIDIDKIHRGMKAKIRGVALGDEVLNGELVAINGQATPTSGNSLPVFNAVVIVKHLTPEQKKRIRVGMSATIELDLNSYQQLMIPIAALIFDKGNTLVEVLRKDGKIEQRNIRTGAALQDKVAVVSGLQEGEEIIVHAQQTSH